MLLFLGFMSGAGMNRGLQKPFFFFNILFVSVGRASYSGILEIKGILVTFCVTMIKYLTRATSRKRALFLLLLLNSCGDSKHEKNDM